MTPQCNPKNLCVREPERDKRIRVKPSIFFLKKKNFNQQTKVSVRVIKDNSISLLEFVFDLNLMRSFFLKILLKLFRIKIKIF